MVSVKERGLLLHIIEHCNRISSKMTGIDINSFSKDEDVQEIVCFNLLQIGELVKKLPDGFIKKYTGIPWNKIAGMRDIIAHGYGSIRLEDVYRTTAMDIEPLKIYCEEILKEK